MNLLLIDEDRKLKIVYSSKSFDSFVREFNILLDIIEFPYTFPNDQTEFFNSFQDFLYFGNIYNYDKKIVFNYSIVKHQILISLVIDNLHFINVSFCFNDNNKSIKSIITDYTTTVFTNKSLVGNDLYEMITEFLYTLDPENSIFNRNSEYVPLWYLSMLDWGASNKFISNLLTPYDFFVVKSEIGIYWMNTSGYFIRKIQDSKYENEFSLYLFDSNLFHNATLSEVFAYIKSLV